MKKIYLLAAFALALTACDSNDDNTSATSSRVPARVTASIAESVASRAAGTQWANGDKIGITINVKAEDENDETLYPTDHTNVCYTTDGGSEFKGDPLFFYWPMVVTAYYPYSDTQEVVPGNPGKLTAVTSPEKQTATGQPDFDFLFATGETTIKNNLPEVNFNFAHRMSKVTFTFISSEDAWNDGVKISEGVDVGNMVAYEIDDLALRGTFDTATGECAADTDGEKGFRMEFAKGTVESEKAMPSLIIFPQELEEGHVTLHIYNDEVKGDGASLQRYNCNLSFSDGEILPGCHYSYSITVTKYGLMVGKLSIVDWTDEPRRVLTATIDGDPEFNNPESGDDNNDNN